MNGRMPKKVLYRLALATATLLALAGCGTQPLAPGSLAGGAGTDATVVESSGPPILTFASDGTATFTPAPMDAPREDAHELLGLLNSLLSTTFKVIDGLLGGTVTNGRYSVEIPAGAIDGSGKVSLVMVDPNKMIVDLSITPLSLNSFSVPVTLVADTRGLALTEPLTIYYYDPVQRKWIDLGATRDPNTGRLTVKLYHFSRYATGKAGW
jgi:hypothetical protein